MNILPYACFNQPALLYGDLAKTFYRWLLSYVRVQVKSLHTGFLCTVLRASLICVPSVDLLLIIHPPCLPTTAENSQDQLDAQRQVIYSHASAHFYCASDFNKFGGLFQE